jgi:DNA uptake protein ComE-like DNA-binding protein
MKEKEKGRGGLQQSFLTGVIALVFMLVGYQTALLVHRAAVLKIAANRDEPDTVYIQVHEPVQEHEPPVTVTKSSSHSLHAQTVRRNLPYKAPQSFRFNPNTVSVEELCRLGFTQRQAESIDAYRRKGGRFHRRSDFAKSYVVSDSIYRRLEKYIDIPLVDINAADSTALDDLPGIGGWYASKIIEYRKLLGGYSYKEQLMDIYRFDQERYDRICDLIEVGREGVVPFDLWGLPADSLCKHPYIRNMETARSIVLYRLNVPKDKWTVDALEREGILSHEDASRLMKCIIVSP